MDIEDLKEYLYSGRRAHVISLLKRLSFYAVYGEQAYSSSFKKHVGLSS